jgi:hypothetical protein
LGTLLSFADGFCKNENVLGMCAGIGLHAQLNLLRNSWFLFFVGRFLRVISILEPFFSNLFFV